MQAVRDMGKIAAILGFWLLFCATLIFKPAHAGSFPLKVEQLAAADSPIADSMPAPDAPWRIAESSESLRLANNDWLRLTVPPIASTQPLYLVTPRRATGTLALWMPNTADPLISDHYLGPFPDTLSSRYHVFEIPQNLPSGLTMLLEAQGQTSIIAPELITRDTLYARDHRQFGFDVALRTILVAMAVVNLLTWLLLHEKVYAKYTAYILIMLAAFTAHDGSLYSLPILSEWGRLGYSGIWILICISVVLLISFARDFLSTRTYAIGIDRSLLALQVLFFVDAVLGMLLFDQLSALLAWITGAGYVVVVVLLLLCGAIATRRGETHGWIFLIGFTPHAVAMSVQAFGLLGIATTPRWMYTAFTITVAFEATIFAFGLGYLALLYRRERDAALALADNDELTQVYNRRAIDRKLHRLCAMVKDSELPVIALLFIDLDHFKRINDAYGHATGDECLRQIAGMIQAELRLGDLLGRYGGEEFIVILPGSDRDDAHGIAERIRKRASMATIVAGAHQVRVHLSIGVAAASGSDSDATTLLARADAAMYRSKTDGRNRVTLTV